LAYSPQGFFLTIETSNYFSMQASRQQALELHGVCHGANEHVQAFEIHRIFGKVGFGNTYKYKNKQFSLEAIHQTDWKV
jgi:hypothetical protein